MYVNFLDFLGGRGDGRSVHPAGKVRCI